MQMHAIEYDLSAGEYAAHRQIHGGVWHELRAQSDLDPGARVLEVGCGTGNYISALAETLGCTAYGLDPSIEMLSRVCSDGVHCLLGRAEELGFADATFHLVYSVDVIHHIGDKAAFYREGTRVLQPGGWLCTVTDSADMLSRREILSGYFPETIEIELARYPRIAQLERWMNRAGLVSIQVSAVEEPYQVTSIQPFRDRAYSSLHTIAEEAWQAGLERLERDLAHGPIQGVARYACVWGRKPAA
jgi:ubiquinone/menaquinone biosynthesis C-methylase UbiE